MTFRKISRCSRICNGSARSTRRKGASTFSFHFLLHPPSYPRLPIFFLFLLFPLFSFVSTIHRASSNWSEFALREREYREKIFSFRRPTVISTCRMIDILWKCLMLWLDVKKRMKKTRTKEVWWQRERERERERFEEGWDGNGRETDWRQGETIAERRIKWRFRIQSRGQPAPRRWKGFHPVSRTLSLLPLSSFPFDYIPVTSSSVFISLFIVSLLSARLSFNWLIYVTVYRGFCHLTVASKRDTRFGTKPPAIYLWNITHTRLLPVFKLPRSFRTAYNQVAVFSSSPFISTFFLYCFARRLTRRKFDFIFIYDGKRPENRDEWYVFDFRSAKTLSRNVQTVKYIFEQTATWKPIF